MRPTGFEPATLGLGPQCSIRAELRAHETKEKQADLKLTLSVDFNIV